MIDILFFGLLLTHTNAITLSRTGTMLRVYLHYKLIIRTSPIYKITDFEWVLITLLLASLVITILRILIFFLQNAAAILLTSVQKCDLIYTERFGIVTASDCKMTFCDNVMLLTTGGDFYE